MLAVVMSGGYGYTDFPGGILEAMSSVRRGMTLDLVERFLEDGRVRCVVCTDDGKLAREVGELGAEVVWTGGVEGSSEGRIVEARTAKETRTAKEAQIASEATENEPVIVGKAWSAFESRSGDESGNVSGFDWLATLQAAVRTFGRDREEPVVVVGGCGAPFLTGEGVCGLVELEGDGVWQNNRMSPDIVRVKPATAVFAVHECRNDNEFGFALESQAGLPVHYFPPELGLFFDVDTPLDALLAANHPSAGQRLRVASTFLPHRVPLDDLLAVLRRRDYPDVALLGRVHPVEAERFGQTLGLRIRVFSEERGMKALGRVEKGLVRSLIATLIDTQGVEAFFSELNGMASAVLWDTRVLFAHKHLELSDHDRFAADLGLPEFIRDPFLRRFTQAAVVAKIPVLTGGQALVSGALRLLRESTRVEN